MHILQGRQHNQPLLKLLRSGGLSDHLLCIAILLPCAYLLLLLLLLHLCMCLDNALWLHY